MKRFWLFALCALLVFQPGSFTLAEEEQLTDSELTDLLYEMELEDGQAGDFLVLPEEFEMPVTGLEGVYCLLLIGVDTNNQDLKGRSDTMVLAVLNTRARSVKLISFMRDLYVRIPGRGHNRLNAAHVYGGPELLVKTLETNFQVPVDGYMAVDFELMAGLVDAIGGIDLQVNEAEQQSVNGILEYYHRVYELPGQPVLLGAAGKVHLDGHQAMAYSRIRKMDSDFERVGRQQKTLRAIFEKLTRLDFQVLGSLMTEFMPRVKTNVSLQDALELLPLVFSMADADISALTVPIKGGSKNVTKNKAAFLVPNLKRNVNAISAFLDSKQP